MDYIKGAITHYLAFPDLGHAIFIKGPWGCGKTYYLNETIKPLIISKKLMYCYISINGFNDPSQIGQRMLLEANPAVKDKIPSVLSETFNILFAAGKACGYLNDAKFDIDPSKISDLSKCVFIIDDLERSSIPVKELFGYLNKFIEHSKLQFILIGNEEELILNNFEGYQIQEDRKESEPNKNPAIINTYLRIKEKVVGRTIAFIQDLKTVIPDMAKNVLGEGLEFEAAISLQPLFEELNTNHTLNLRTVKAALFSFKFLCDNYPVEDGVPQKELLYLSKLFRFIFAITAELADGKAKFVENLFKIRTYIDFIYRFISSKDSDTKAFYEKFFKFEENVLFSHACFEFLMTGNLLNKKWVKELCPPPTSASEADKPLSPFDNYLNLDQKELEDRIDNLMGNIDSNFIPYTKFPRVFQFIEFLINTKAIPHDLNNLFNRFNLAIAAVNRNESCSVNDDDDFLHFLDNEQASSYLKRIIDLTQELRAEINTNFQQNKANEIKDILKSSNSKIKTIAAFFENNRIKHSPLFNFIPGKEMVELLKACSANQLNNYLKLLDFRYNFSNLNDFFQVNLNIFNLSKMN